MSRSPRYDGSDLVRAAALALALGVWFTQASLADAPTLRPGQYEKTTELSMAGKGNRPPRKEVICVDGKDIKDIANAIGTRNRSEACTRSDFKTTAGSVAYTEECALPNGAKTTMKTEITFTSAESFRAVVVMNTAGGAAPMPFLQDTTITVTGKRIGDCTK